MPAVIVGGRCDSLCLEKPLYNWECSMLGKASVQLGEMKCHIFEMVSTYVGGKYDSVCSDSLDGCVVGGWSAAYLRVSLYSWVDGKWDSVCLGRSFHSWVESRGPCTRGGPWASGSKMGCCKLG